MTTTTRLETSYMTTTITTITIVTLDFIRTGVRGTEVRGERRGERKLWCRSGTDRKEEGEGGKGWFMVILLLLHLPRLRHLLVLVLRVRMNHAT